ncbi:MAG: RNA polymerase sporulation sigma factor SigH [Actinomycetota bacterium]|nr:RNA polymerase sporulation sigma factor SigH [Actinomycetota bacterium]
MATTFEARPGSDLEDRDLVRHAREGDQRCLEVLLTRHRPLVRAVARRYFLRGHDTDDVIQEGTIGLYRAVRDFDPDQETPFRAFAELCISRQIVTAVKGANRFKHTPLNASISIDRPTRTSEESPQITLADRLAAHVFDPALLVIAADEIKALRDTLRRGLTKLESDVLHLFMHGKSYEEIAAKLGAEIKHVDNALQRIRMKVRRHLHHRKEPTA